MTSRDEDDFGAELLDAPDEALTLFALAPPVFDEGVLLKGLLVSHTLDPLFESIPGLGELYEGVSTTYATTWPRSRQATFLMTQWRNDEREIAFRARHPDRHHQLVLPFGPADLTSQYFFHPDDTPPDIDVLVVARDVPEKRLDLLVEAIELVSRRLSAPLKVAWITAHPHSPEGHALAALCDHVGPAEYWTQMPGWYRRSKVLVVAAGDEGKSRAMAEAMACDCPVVCFEDYGRPSRGETPVLPSGAGVVAKDRQAGALADALLETFELRSALTPRRGWLEISGRGSVIDACYRASLDAQRSFAQAGSLPSVRSSWLDAACWKTHGHSFHDQIHERDGVTSLATGLASARALVDQHRAALVRAGWSG